MEDILKELGYDTENIHSSIEHDDSKKELLKLEKKYNINTKNIVNNYNKYKKIVSKNDLRSWLSYYDTFTFFNGKKSSINSI